MPFYNLLIFKMLNHEMFNLNFQKNSVNNKIYLNDQRKTIIRCVKTIYVNQSRY